MVVSDAELLALIENLQPECTAAEEIGSGTNGSWNVQSEADAIQQLVDYRGCYKSKFLMILILQL